MTTWEFPSTEPADIRISSWPSGSVAVSGEQTDKITVKVVPARSGGQDLLDQVQVSFDHGQLTIIGPEERGFFRRHSGLDLTVTAPAGSNCDARTASADVACVGDLGELTVRSASGDVTASSARGRVVVKTASGDVAVDKAGGDVDIDTASGDAQVTSVRGELWAKTVSGDVLIGTCDGSVTASTTSGDIQLRDCASGTVEMASISGDLTVAVRRGVGVYLDLSTMSGSVRSDLDTPETASEAGEQTATLTVKCRTISGDIVIRKGIAASATDGPGQGSTGSAA
jgi:Putative adhesin